MSLGEVAILHINLDLAFPLRAYDACTLSQHQTECHDPIAAVRKDRGEKIVRMLYCIFSYCSEPLLTLYQFACYLAECNRVFSTPKTRRMHLIQAHNYPKEYFFAVTNKGVGGLLKRWGEGASLLRKPWRPRENGAKDTPGQDGDEYDGGGDEDYDDHDDSGADAMDADHLREPVQRPIQSSEDDEDDEIVLLEKIRVDRPATRSNETVGASTPLPKGRHRGEPNVDVENLANSMDALSLVPSSIQFGRGAKRGGLRGARGHGRRGSAGRGRMGHDGEDAVAMDVDQGLPAHRRGRGRGGQRGGARGASPMPPRGGAVRGSLPGPRGRGRGFPRAAPVFGPAVGRGMGPGRGVNKDSLKS